MRSGEKEQIGNILDAIARHLCYKTVRETGSEEMIRIQQDTPPGDFGRTSGTAAFTVLAREAGCSCTMMPVVSEGAKPRNPETKPNSIEGCKNVD
jgi:hypothetical protein